jgi:predicted 2-oxoglutarate/Fe(II)-dependent dioxygenase YbiX
MVDNIIEKILRSKIASLPVLMKSLRSTSFYWIFKTIREDKKDNFNYTADKSHVVATNENSILLA